MVSVGWYLVFWDDTTSRQLHNFGVYIFFSFFLDEMDCMREEKLARDGLSMLFECVDKGSAWGDNSTVLRFCLYQTRERQRPREWMSGWIWSPSSRERQRGRELEYRIQLLTNFLAAYLV